MFISNKLKMKENKTLFFQEKTVFLRCFKSLNCGLGSKDSKLKIREIYVLYLTNSNQRKKSKINVSNT